MPAIYFLHKKIRLTGLRFSLSLSLFHPSRVILILRIFSLKIVALSCTYIKSRKLYLIFVIYTEIIIKVQKFYIKHTFYIYRQMYLYKIDHFLYPQRYDFRNFDANVKKKCIFFKQFEKF